MSLWEWTEFFAVCCGLLFIILISYQHILCWFFGILGSLASIALFVHSRLYAEAVLHILYAIVGVWGWYKWSVRTKDGVPLAISIWPLQTHLRWWIGGSISSALLGFALAHFTNANNPYVDASIFMFSMMATLMEGKKILSSWLYWIVLNAASVALYWVRGLEMYSGLMLVYVALSIWGWIKWKRVWQKKMRESMASVGGNPSRVVDDATC